MNFFDDIHIAVSPCHSFHATLRFMRFLHSMQFLLQVTHNAFDATGFGTDNQFYPSAEQIWQCIRLNKWACDRHIEDADFGKKNCLAFHAPCIICSFYCKSHTMRFMRLVFCKTKTVLGQIISFILPPNKYGSVYA